MVMGAQVARLVRTTTTTPTTLVHAFFFIFVSTLVVTSFGAPDADALLKFKHALGNAEALANWNSSTNPCDWSCANWVGVLCLNDTIWGLQLEHMGLTGTIDVDALLPLPYFRTISLMNNKFEGPLPDIKKLGKLKALYLSNNRFSGNIEDNAFEGMRSLKRIYLANNEFTGNIPLSLTTLSKLMELRLEGNQFEGQIPYFQQKGLKTVYLASNELRGPIPPSLSHLSPNSFSGNKDLCGPPLDLCKSPTSPPPTFPPHKKKSNILKSIIIVMIAVVVLIAIAVAFATLYQRKQATQSDRRRQSSPSSNPNQMTTTSHNRSNHQAQAHSESIASSTRTRRSDNGKLSFVRDGIEKFDLQDLLRASAKVLGSGTFGASYKAVVMGGQALVVKRYRNMNIVGREEFHEHMRRLGRLKHPNLLPLVAYYYRKEEKLFVSEFVENGSLASHLHGNHSVEGGLDWHTRLKIIKGIAKGLAYLYNELPIMVPHSHLKSSNVLLDDSMEPLLTDYALRPVTNPENAHMLMIAYKSPEYTQHGCTSNKTDVWSFGILILEILTGKFPENYLTQGYKSTADLATWVNGMVKEKRTSEVFDKEMLGTKNSKSEMLNVLKIGLSCCEEDVERRLEINEVVEMIEKLKEVDVIEEQYYGTETNGFRVRGCENNFSLALDR